MKREIKEKIRGKGRRKERSDRNKEKCGGRGRRRREKEMEKITRGKKNVKDENMTKDKNKGIGGRKGRRK